MRTLKLIFILLLYLGRVLFSVEAMAQSVQSPLPADFNYVKRCDVRLNSQNPTGLSHLSYEKISKVKLSGTHERGNLINYYQSSNSLNGEIGAESYYRLSPKVVMHGAISYQYFEGKNMGGSAFINPNETPFNIIEYNDTTRGVKQKETYHLIGGVSYQPQKRLTLAANIDYSAINYTKRKDLRHRNKALDLELTTGASYVAIANLLEIGLNYYYRKRVEGLYFNIYGTTDKQYTSLIDYGGFYGMTEGFVDNGDGYTSGKRERPLVDNYHGIAIQTDWQVMPTAVLHTEFFAKKREGYYGVETSSTVLYSNHKSNIVGYNGAFALHQGKNLHQVRFTRERETLDNFENVYNIINIEGGLSQVEYYGDNKVLEQKKAKTSLSYSLFLDTKGYRPKSELHLSATLENRERITSLYPYYRVQNLKTGSLNLVVLHNILKKKNVFTFSLGATYSKGDGDPFIDGTYATPSATEKAPKSVLLNLYREHEFLTASRIALNPSIKFARLIKNNKLFYTQLNYAIDYLPKPTYLSKQRHSFLLAIGLEF